jgi:hypothetical protein
VPLGVAGVGGFEHHHPLKTARDLARDPLQVGCHL